MAARKGLRVTCAVCRRVFYLTAWGAELPEHQIGRSSDDPVCSGSRRADYLPASSEAMAAQMEWAAEQAPKSSPRRSSPAKQKPKIVDARHTKLARLKTRLGQKEEGLRALLDDGIEAYRRRQEAKPEEAVLMIRQQDRLLQDEKRLRDEIARLSTEAKDLERRL